MTAPAVNTTDRRLTPRQIAWRSKACAACSNDPPILRARPHDWALPWPIFAAKSAAHATARPISAPI
ncbi:hypothetical protein QWZ10_14120 [Paracoccus cavernae]|uniref:Uncharacterized protein n=1 Tax=Paracoccus cavernae TaxID=1571207 RepID=A0ABT8DAW2_9RHOB|nr:hypothetical protein [Paracoccus cavernae]